MFESRTSIFWHSGEQYSTREQPEHRFQESSNSLLHTGLAHGRTVIRMRIFLHIWIGIMCIDAPLVCYF